MNKAIHWLASIILFGIPILLATHSPFLDVSVGAILNAIYLYVSQKVNPTVSAPKPRF